jgi:hypothetical protein
MGTKEMLGRYAGLDKNLGVKAEKPYCPPPPLFNLEFSSG